MTVSREGGKKSCDKFKYRKNIFILNRDFKYLKLVLNYGNFVIKL